MYLINLKKKIPYFFKPTDHTNSNLVARRAKDMGRLETNLSFYLGDGQAWKEGNNA